PAGRDGRRAAGGSRAWWPSGGRHPDVLDSHFDVGYDGQLELQLEVASELGGVGGGQAPGGLDGHADALAAAADGAAGPGPAVGVAPGGQLERRVHLQAQRPAEAEAGVGPHVVVADEGRAAVRPVPSEAALAADPHAAGGQPDVRVEEAWSR